METHPVAPGSVAIRPARDCGVLCGRCGHGNPAGAKFCGECGVLLGSKCARRQVTVLFTDVCDFTRMSERLDPEDVRTIMDRAFDVILDVVHRHGGAVNQFLGDGVMALFGSSTVHDDDPYRAVRAALAIQAGLEPLRAEVQRAHGVDFRIRIGINTGPVMVGVIGNGLRNDYIASGSTTTVAARLLSVGRAGQTLISAATRDATEGTFVVADIGNVVVDGMGAPIRVHAVTREIDDHAEAVLLRLVDA
jgi:class 3 adenylate cyclase